MVNGAELKGIPFEHLNGLNRSHVTLCPNSVNGVIFVNKNENGENEKITNSLTKAKTKTKK